MDQLTAGKKKGARGSFFLLGVKIGAASAGKLDFLEHVFMHRIGHQRDVGDQ